jgi:hypothetical protein
LHSKVEFGFEEVKEKLGLGLPDGSDGCAVMLVVGGKLSSETVCAAEAPVFPARSVPTARTT